jgi:lycopene cyclase CruP
VSLLLIDVQKVNIQDVQAAFCPMQAEITDKETLGLINAYSPGLSSAWMLQRAMSVRVGEAVDRTLINRMLASNFSSMAASGDDVMKPFLQVRP